MKKNFRFLFNKRNQRSQKNFYRTGSVSQHPNGFGVEIVSWRMEKSVTRERSLPVAYMKLLFDF